MKKVIIVVLFFLAFKYSGAEILSDIHANVLGKKQVVKQKITKESTFLYKFGSISEKPAKTITIFYDTLGNLTDRVTIDEVKFKAGYKDSLVINYLYDSFGRVTSSSKKEYYISPGSKHPEVDSSGDKDVQTYKYDNNGKISDVTVNLGYSITNYKFTNGQIMEMVCYRQNGDLDYNGSFEYQNERLTHVIWRNARGSMQPNTVIKYNSNGLMTDSTVLTPETSGWEESIKVKYKYDKNNLLVERVKTKPAFSKYEYLYNGTVLNEVNVYNDDTLIEKINYDLNGNVVERTKYVVEAGKTIPKQVSKIKYEYYE